MVCGTPLIPTSKEAKLMDAQKDMILELKEVKVHFKMDEGILKAVVMCAWIFMMIKTSHNEDYRLPIFGDLAERSANEQR